MKRLNLLPEELRSRRARKGQGPLAGLSPLAAGGIVGAAVVVTMVIAQGAAAWRYRAGVTRLKAETEQLRILGAQLNGQQQQLAVRRGQLMAQRERLRTTLEVLQRARQPAVPVSELFVELARVLPEDVSVTKLSLSDETLKVAGISKDTRSVATLIGAMDRSGRFRNTTFAYTQRSSQPQAPGFVFEVSTTPVMQDKTVGTR